MTELPAIDLDAAKRALTAEARALGFDALGVAAIDIAADERHLLRWLEAGLHGDMDYMRRHARLRARPEELLPGAVRVVSVRMDYWPGEARPAEEVLGDPTLGYVSRYALGRDYHKVLRRALANLATGSRGGSGPSATGCASTARRCWRRPTRATPGSAGSASTPTSSRAKPARGSSSAKS
ncbi:MAG TPA: QueG-associated DUF1730 domain-containing protein [Steroidobacteraceae bacterium]|nr:QueG-associated DUF1730 domain-containing protein [Steroidobacteraceae bacterium]